MRTETRDAIITGFAGIWALVIIIWFIRTGSFLPAASTLAGFGIGFYLRSRR